MNRASGKLDLVATAIEPIHHGAGTSGNTQILRMQEIVLPDGTNGRVPFISGNSLKHKIRDAGVKFALNAMGVEDGSLSKAAITLLFSGGQLTKKGTALNLDRAREIEALFPIVSVCGYAASNFMQSSKLAVGHFHLACVENAWRVPAVLVGNPMLQIRAGALRSDEFGTCHEPTRDPRVVGLLKGADVEKIQAALIERIDAPNKVAPTKMDTVQMIYDFETIRPGAVFWGWMRFSELTDLEMTAFRSALSYACEGIQAGKYIYALGAKNSVGFGRMAIEIKGALQVMPSAPAYTECTDLIPMDGSSEISAYVAHLKTNREAILSALEEMAG